MQAAPVFASKHQSKAGHRPWAEFKSGETTYHDHNFGSIFQVFWRNIN
jgi:hypothetical protein